MKNKIAELRNLSQEELLHKEKALKEDLFKLNQQRYSGRVDKPHMFFLVKRDIARIKTLLKEKKENTNG
ncbi:MAG: 50S ribosomal protein L29 [Candidatus Omnitrophica bacterium]|nr:50S ribosomal protein L29 [Candidatus Omnitrophota bacterium]